jgi:hypothetical protein
VADIFVSYAREDRETASSLVDVLASRRWAVFWDHHIPTGKSFDRVIEQELDAARCVIVLWSRHSVASDWVRAEAREGARRQILHPVQIDETTLPLEFRHLQTANLSSWRPGTPHSEFDRLLGDLAAAIEGTPRHPPPVEAPRPRPPIYARRPIQALFAGAVCVIALAVWWSRGPAPGPARSEPSQGQVAIRETPAPVREDAAPPPVQKGNAPSPVQKGDAPIAPKRPAQEEPKKPEGPSGGQEKEAPPPDVVKPVTGPPPVNEQPAPPVAAKPAPQPAPTPVADEASLRESISAYAQAVSSGNPDAVRAVFPSVSAQELRDVESVRDNFGRDRYFMNIIVLDPRINGKQAEVLCRVFHNGIDNTGKPLRQDRQETLKFNWTGSTWVRVR